MHTYYYKCKVSNAVDSTITECNFNGKYPDDGVAIGTAINNCHHKLKHDFNTPIEQQKINVEILNFQCLK